MDERKQKMWDVLAGLNGETVARLFTDWHGTQLLDDGFFGHLVDEGYIDEPEPEEEEEDEETNCDDGTYDCSSCVLNGNCDRQDAMKSEEFNEFCGAFDNCEGCPLNTLVGDCEDELWPKWMEEHANA